MSREWKPGDVAMVRCSDGEWRRAMFVDNHNWPEWRFADGLLRKAYDSAARPLVVIDPTEIFPSMYEDAAARVAKFLREVVTWTGGRISGGNHHLDLLAAQFESVATPPKPDEPTGAAALVEDADGDWWTRLSRGSDGAVWHRIGIPDRRANYDQIAAVKVLFEGAS